MVVAFFIPKQNVTFLAIFVTAIFVKKLLINLFYRLIYRITAIKSEINRISSEVIAIKSRITDDKVRDNLN